jgi:hypothetical protein
MSSLSTKIFIVWRCDTMLASFETSASLPDIKRAFLGISILNRIVNINSPATLIAQLSFCREVTTRFQRSPVIKPYLGDVRRHGQAFSQDLCIYLHAQFTKE